MKLDQMEDNNANYNILNRHYYYYHYFGTTIDKELKDILLLRTESKTKQEAFQRLTTLANEGNANAQLILGEWIEFGEDVERSYLLVQH